MTGGAPLLYHDFVEAGVMNLQFTPDCTLTTCRTDLYGTNPPMRPAGESVQGVPGRPRRLATVRDVVLVAADEHRGTKSAVVAIPTPPRIWDVLTTVYSLTLPIVQTLS